MPKWVTKQTLLIGGGGSWTPWGADTQIQFNNSGSFGWDARFTFDPATWWTTWGDFAVEAWASIDGGWAWFYAQGWRVWSGWIVQAYAGNAITLDSDGGWFQFSAGSWNGDGNWWDVQFFAWGSPWAGIWWDVEFRIGWGGTIGKYIFNNSATTAKGDFNFESLTTNRTYTLPDASWTIALAPHILALASWIFLT